MNNQSMTLSAMAFNMMVAMTSLTPRFTFRTAAMPAQAAPAPVAAPAVAAIQFLHPAAHRHVEAEVGDVVATADHGVGAGHVLSGHDGPRVPGREGVDALGQ